MIAFKGLFLMLSAISTTIPFPQISRSNTPDQSVQGQQVQDAIAEKASLTAKFIPPQRENLQNYQSVNTLANSSNLKNTKETKQSAQDIQQVLAQLKARDTEVRAHEAAHLAVAGQYATSGMNFTYQSGPDGRRYAIGGDVSIDASAIAGNPEATLKKAKQVQAAALAPAEPSAQDQRVAAQAVQMMSKARLELQQQSLQKIEDSSIQKASGSHLEAGKVDRTQFLVRLGLQSPTS